MIIGLSVYVMSFINLYHTYLQQFFPKLVFPYRSAFVPNKDIHDNILESHEFLSTFTQKV